jgi:hypothetical protein
MVIVPDAVAAGVPLATTDTGPFVELPELPFPTQPTRSPLKPAADAKPRNVRRSNRSAPASVARFGSDGSFVFMRIPSDRLLGLAGVTIRAK